MSTKLCIVDMEMTYIWKQLFFASFKVKRLKKLAHGTSLAVQWLRLCVSTTGGSISIPSWRTKIPHAAWHGPKVKTKKTKRYPKKLGTWEYHSMFIIKVAVDLMSACILMDCLGMKHTQMFGISFFEYNNKVNRFLIGRNLWHWCLDDF